MLDKSIFKSYDIRGIYPIQLNEDLAYKIGRAFIVYTGAKQVVVTQDMRISSPKLFQALTKGIIEQGANVINVGQTPIDCLYFSVGKYEYDGGIMVTASHNPKEYNGFKMVKKGVSVIRGTDIYQLVQENSFPSAEKTGKISAKDILPDFISHVLSFISLKKIKPLKVVIDTSNGMAGQVIALLKDKLPIKIISLNMKLEGNVPAHSYNPRTRGATEQISQTIKNKGADFGCIFDGDGDRIFLIDGKGSFVRADITLLILAKYFLQKNPGSAIVYNLICSRAVPEFVKKWGGQPVRSPVGFVNIKENMIKNKALLGGELSGHYSFQDNFYSDSGMIAFLVLLQIISQNGREVSEMVKELDIYISSEEINFQIEDKEGLIEKVKQKYSDAQQNFLDGLTVEYEDWWFNLRPSNTEPLLRLNVEAKNKELLGEKIKGLSALITQ